MTPGAEEGQPGLALILASIAIVFFVGFVAKMALLPG